MPSLKLIKGFNSITETLKKKPADQICSEKEFVKIIENERARADRNNLFFSLILFDIASIDAEKVSIGRLIESITRRIRKVDNVGWYDNRHIGVILPYTSNDGACQLATDIYSETEMSCSPNVCHVNTYPADRTLT